MGGGLARGEGSWRAKRDGRGSGERELAYSKRMSRREPRSRTRGRNPRKPAGEQEAAPWYSCPTPAPTMTHPFGAAFAPHAIRRNCSAPFAAFQLGGEAGRGAEKRRAEVRGRSAGTPSERTPARRRTWRRQERLGRRSRLRSNAAKGVGQAGGEEGRVHLEDRGLPCDEGRVLAGGARDGGRRTTRRSAEGRVSPTPHRCLWADGRQ